MLRLPPDNSMLFEHYTRFILLTLRSCWYLRENRRVGVDAWPHRHVQRAGGGGRGKAQCATVDWMLTSLRHHTS